VLDMNFFAFNRGFEAEEFEAEEFNAEFPVKGTSKAMGKSRSTSQHELFASPDDVFPVYQPMDEPTIYEVTDFTEEPVKITSTEVVNKKDGKVYFSNKIDEEEEESATEVTSHHETTTPGTQETAVGEKTEERPIR